MIPVLTQEDLEEPRLPDDLFNWVREIRARFGATKAVSADARQEASEAIGSKVAAALGAAAGRKR